jgi:hypothetical protein
MLLGSGAALHQQYHWYSAVHASWQLCSNSNDPSVQSWAWQLCLIGCVGWGSGHGVLGTVKNLVLFHAFQGDVEAMFMNA